MVLPQIVHKHARFGLRDLDRPELLHHFNRRGGLRDELSAGTRTDNCLFPRRVVGTRFVPTGDFSPCVVVLAAIDAREPNRPISNLPRAVADDDRGRAVGIIDVQLQDQLRRAKGTGKLRIAAAHDIVHAVSEHDAQHIAAPDQSLRYVERAVETRFAVVGPAGLKNAVAKLFAVQTNFVKAQAANIDFSAAHRLGHVKRPSQKRQRQGGIDLRRCGDPFRLPILGIQQTHAPLCRLAPGRRLSLHVPNSNLPTTSPARR